MRRFPFIWPILTLALFTACGQAPDVPFSVPGDGDQAEAFESTEREEAAAEVDAEVEAPDGDAEREAEAEPLDGDAEAEAENETEAESEGYLAPETDVDLDEIPRAERLPFSNTLIFPCADEQGVRATHAFWGDGAGSVFYGNTHLWRYDEATNSLYCDPEPMTEIRAIEGRRGAKETELWVLAKDRLAKKSGGVWQSVPLPEGFAEQPVCGYFVHMLDVMSTYFCGWASLRLHDDTLAVTLTRTQAESGDRYYDGWATQSELYLFDTKTLLWTTPADCPGLRPGDETQGYWLSDTYYLLAQNTLYALKAGTQACQRLGSFAPQAPDQLFRLYGANENGLWLAEYAPRQAGEGYFRKLVRALLYNPATATETPLARPHIEGQATISANGLAGFPLLFRSYSIAEIENGWMGRRCETTSAFWTKPDDFAALDLAREEFFEMNGNPCMTPERVTEETAFRPPMQAQHWRDGQRAWLPDLLMRVTYAR